MALLRQEDKLSFPQDATFLSLAQLTQRVLHKFWFGQATQTVYIFKIFIGVIWHRFGFLGKSHVICSLSCLLSCKVSIIKGFEIIFSLDFEQKNMSKDGSPLPTTVQSLGSQAIFHPYFIWEDNYILCHHTSLKHSTGPAQGPHNLWARLCSYLLC